MSDLTTFLYKCPRCKCLSVIDDSYPGCSESEIDYCLVCGWYAGDNFECDLPHMNYAYHFSDIDPRNLIPIRELHGEPNIKDLTETEAWLKAREENGYEFTYFVVAGMDGKVYWLRGDPEHWDCKHE